MNSRHEVSENHTHRQEQDLLYQLAHDLARSPDVRTIANHLFTRAKNLLSADYGFLMLANPEGTELRGVAAYGMETEIFRQERIAVSKELAPVSLAFQQKQPVVIPVIPGNPQVSKRLRQQYHFVQAAWAVPLMNGDKAVGVLVVGYAAPQEATVADLRLLQLLGDEAALAVERARLTEELREREEALLKEEGEVTAALARVGQEMISSLDTPVILERLCRLTAEVLDCDYSHTTLWQPTEDAYVVVAGYGETSEQAEARRASKMPRMMLAPLLTRLAKEEVIEFETEASRDSVTKSLLRKLHLATTLWVPLWRGTEIIGMQSASRRGSKRFSRRYKRIARGISQIASLALGNARLFEELERANRLKEDFVSSMSHELRTPLNIIMGYSDLLHEENFGPLTAEQSHPLERINKSARELLDLINATLDFSRLQSQRSPVSVREVGAAELLAELEVDAHQLNRKSSVRLEWQPTPALPSLYTDPLKLKMILKNLITNALKFTDEGVITVGAHPEGTGIEFCVSDTGIGIAPEALPIIFEPFRQVDSSLTRRHGGVGLGLYIVRQLLNLLGGTVAVESTLGKGSTFRVWVPLHARQ